MEIIIKLTEEMVEDLEAMGHDMGDVEERVQDSIADLLYELSATEP